MKGNETESEVTEVTEEEGPVVLSPSEVRYLDDKHITEEDPMVYLAWRVRNATAFINAANANPMPILQQSATSTPWMSSELELVVPSGVLVAHLALYGGGSFPPAIVAPNTTQQCVNVVLELRMLEISPWFQAVAGAVGAGPLATIYLVKDRRVSTSPERQNPVPLGPGLIQLFA